MMQTVTMNILTVAMLPVTDARLSGTITEDNSEKVIRSVSTHALFSDFDFDGVLQIHQNMQKAAKVTAHFCLRLSALKLYYTMYLKFMRDIVL